MVDAEVCRAREAVAEDDRVLVRIGAEPVEVDPAVHGRVVAVDAAFGQLADEVEPITIGQPRDRRVPGRRSIGPSTTSAARHRQHPDRADFSVPPWLIPYATSRTVGRRHGQKSRVVRPLGSIRHRVDQSAGGAVGVEGVVDRVILLGGAAQHECTTARRASRGAPTMNPPRATRTACASNAARAGHVACAAAKGHPARPTTPWCAGRPHPRATGTDPARVDRESDRRWARGRRRGRSSADPPRRWHRSG